MNAFKDFFSKWLFFSINCFVDRWCFKLTYANKIIHFFVVITLAKYSLWYSNGFIWHVFKRAHRIDEAFKENLLMAFILFISHVTWFQRFSPQDHRTKKLSHFYFLSLSKSQTSIHKRTHNGLQPMEYYLEYLLWSNCLHDNYWKLSLHHNPSQAQASQTSALLTDKFSHCGPVGWCFCNAYLHDHRDVWKQICYSACFWLCGHVHWIFLGVYLGFNFHGKTECNRAAFAPSTAYLTKLHLCADNTVDPGSSSDVFSPAATVSHHNKTAVPFHYYLEFIDPTVPVVSGLLHHYA